VGDFSESEQELNAALNEYRAAVKTREEAKQERQVKNAKAIEDYESLKAAAVAEAKIKIEAELAGAEVVDAEASEAAKAAALTAGVDAAISSIEKPILEVDPTEEALVVPVRRPLAPLPKSVVNLCLQVTTVGGSGEVVPRAHRQSIATAADALLALKAKSEEAVIREQAESVRTNFGLEERLKGAVAMVEGAGDDQAKLKAFGVFLNGPLPKVVVAEGAAEGADEVMSVWAAVKTSICAISVASKSAESALAGFLIAAGLKKAEAVSIPGRETGVWSWRKLKEAVEEQGDIVELKFAGNLKEVAGLVGDGCEVGGVNMLRCWLSASVKVAEASAATGGEAAGAQ
jgi:hypothetical protein